MSNLQDAWNKYCDYDNKKFREYEMCAAIREADAEIKRLRDGSLPINSENMTAAEEVLAWLYVEKCKRPDDTAISPDAAQEAVVQVIDRIHAQDSEIERLRDALEYSLDVLSGTLMTKNSLISALERGKSALKGCDE